MACGIRVPTRAPARVPRGRSVTRGVSVTTTTAARLGRLGVLAGSLLFVAACSKPPPRDVTPGEVNIRNFGRLYLAYGATQKDGLGPATVEELKKFSAGFDEKKL